MIHLKTSKISIDNKKLVHQTSFSLTADNPFFSGVLRNILLLFLVSLFFASPSLSANLQPDKERIVRVGAFNFYPGIFKDTDGIVKGFYVDALAKVEKSENIRFEYVYGSWSEGIERLKAGKIDILTSVAITPERSVYMDFTKTPLLTVWGELYVPRKSEIDNILAVRGKKIAVMKDDVNGKHFIDLVKRFNISCTFIELPGFEEVFQAIAEKKVDAGVVNCTFGIPKQTEYGLRATGVIFNPFDIYFAAAKGKNKDLLATLDNYLTVWRHEENSIYNTSRQKWGHGKIWEKTTIPRWLKTVTIILVVLGFISLVFIVLLRKQVARATKTIRNREKLLLESEAKYRNLFEHIPVGIIQIGLDGIVSNANPEMAKIFGCSSREELLRYLTDLIGKMAVESSHNQDLISYLLDHGEVKNLELRAPKKDGKVIDFSLSAKIAPLGTTNDGIIDAFVKDITSRKRAEDTLRLIAESELAHGEDIFRFLIKLLATSQAKPYALVARINEGDSGTAHTLAVWQSGAFAENFSYPLAGTPCEQVTKLGPCFYPENIQNLFPEDSLLALMGAESYWGVPLRDTSGAPLGLLAILDTCPMEESSETLSLLISFAARAASEIERRKEQEKYQLLFTEMQEAFSTHEIIVDEKGKPVDYRFLDVNPAFERITGLLRSEVIGKTALEVLPNLDASWVEIYGRVALTGEAVHFENYSHELDRYFEISAFRPEAGRFACIFQDITNRRRVAVEHAKLRDQLYHAQKMEDIGRLTSGVAHDFNNHLTAIIGYSQIILQKLPNDSKILHCAEMVCQAGEKAAALTRSLLAFSRKQPLEMRPVDVVVIIANIRKLLERIIGEDVNLLLEQSATPLFVNGDASHIEQVIMNLATNARDALHDGGTIRIKTERKLLDNEFMSIDGVGQAGEYAVISCSDNGTGIPETDLEKIFEPFYTSKEEGKGTGLGLSIIHGIIMQHGGHIQVESSPNQGTSFFVYLPLISPVAKKEERLENFSPQRGSETILICEDDASVRSLLRVALEENGYKILEAIDGQDAINCFLRHQHQVNLVILDVIMPKINGALVYTEITSLKPEMRVLFISGYTPESIKKSGVFEKNVPFLQKPVLPDLLLMKVREALD